MREIKIGLLGLGTVGSGVVEIINRRREDWSNKYGFKPVIKKVLVQDIFKERAIKIDPMLLTDQIDYVLNDPEIDVVIEVIGGEKPALEYVITALEQKKHVITANKLVLAKHGPKLYRLALRNGVYIGFEASVGGGTPIIVPLQESLTSNRIESLMGIINGTTNFILSEMDQHGEGYFDVLERAQASGYVEADPSSDVEGLDASYKLSILTGIAFGSQIPVENIVTAGISSITVREFQIAKDLGYTIKLIAKARNIEGKIFGHVHPTLLPLNHPLAGVKGVFNALSVMGDAVGEVILYGQGAGMMATGSAVTADLVKICQKILEHRNNRINSRLGEQKKDDNQIPNFMEKDFSDIETAYFFITMSYVKKPDVGEIIQHLSSNQIQINSISTYDNGDQHTLGIMTEICFTRWIITTVNELRSLNGVRKVTYYYVEKEGFY